MNRTFCWFAAIALLSITCGCSAGIWHPAKLVDETEAAESKSARQSRLPFGSPVRTADTSSVLPTGIDSQARDIERRLGIE